MASVKSIHNLLKELRVQIRILFFLVCGSMIFDMFDPAFLILTSPNTLAWKIANMTHHRELVGYAYLLTSVMLVPYLLLHTFEIWVSYTRILTKVAILSLLMSGIIWTFLCYVSWRVEIGWPLAIYIRNIIGSLMFAGFLAAMLNSELRRESMLEIERAHAEGCLIQKLFLVLSTPKESYVQSNTESVEQSGA